MPQSTPHREWRGNRSSTSTATSDSSLHCRLHAAGSPFETRGRLVSTAGDLASIPHDVKYRGAATRSDQKPNPYVSGTPPPPPQIMGSARLNLSRWRNGFEPRWDSRYPRRWPVWRSRRSSVRGPIAPGGRSRDPWRPADLLGFKPPRDEVVYESGPRRDPLPSGRFRT
jgi:hypothetical protein